MLPQIEDVLKSKGEDVPRPDYKSSSAAVDPSSPAENEAEDGGKADVNDVGGSLAVSKLDQFKYSKGNHEATSDEDNE